jgi:hypothetical protein
LESELQNGTDCERIIVHSTLIRAIDTAQLMTRSDVPYLSLQDLNEANQIEHLASSLVKKRIRSFENWLIRNSSASSSVQETETGEEKEKEKGRKPVFVIFGHAQYFKYLLHKSEEMRNCDVWKVSATIDDRTQTVSWGEPSLKHRSPLSYQHPIQVFKASLFGKPNSDMNSPASPLAPVELDLCCRICQVVLLALRFCLLPDIHFPLPLIP